MNPGPRHALRTPPGVGAIAVLRLRGPGSEEVLRRVAARAADAPVGATVHADLAGVDDGLVVRVAEEDWRLMPHGGPVIVRRLMAALGAAGSRPDTRRPRGVDASAVHTLTSAASPAAVDALAAQPRRWRDAAAAGFAGADPAEVLARSRVLDRLVTPPTVVVAGRPNAGKSTLLNRVSGEAAALVSPEAGTTRDWVGRRVALTPAGGDPLADAVVVDWCDTPGLRVPGGPAAGVEARAIGLAAELLRSADLLIELTAPGEAALDRTELPREPDLRVASKSDLNPDPAAAGAVRSVSAATGAGVAGLADEVARRLFPPAARAGLWAFDAPLRAWAQRQGPRPPNRWLAAHGAKDR